MTEKETTLLTHLPDGEAGSQVRAAKEHITKLQKAGVSHEKMDRVFGSDGKPMLKTKYPNVTQAIVGKLATE